jgi:cytochrome P450
MHSLFETHSKTYSSRILGQKMIFTCDPQNIKHMLCGAFSYYDSSRYRAPSFKTLAEHGLFAVDGTEWKAARDVFRSQFSNTSAIVNLDVQEHHLQNFMRCIPPDGGPIHLQEHFINLTQSIVTSFALGDSVEPTSHDPERERLFRNLRYIDKTIVRDRYLGPLRHFTNRRTFFSACSEVQSYVGGFVSKALAIQQNKEKLGSREPSSVLYSLVQGLTEHTQDFDIVRDTTSTVLEAGAASVASLLSSTFWLLARDERVVQKLREEIFDAVGHERPTYEQLRSLKYLRDVLKEGITCRSSKLFFYY